MKEIKKGIATSKVDEQFVMGRLYQMRTQKMCSCSC
jgi:hypothetical protein